MMNTAPLESSFRLQGTPRMGYINILMKTKRRKGFWHISNSSKECFHCRPCPEPHPPPPPTAGMAGEPPGRQCKNHPLGFTAPRAGKRPKAPTQWWWASKKGNPIVWRDNRVTATEQAVSPLQGAQKCHHTKQTQISTFCTECSWWEKGYPYLDFAELVSFGCSSASFISQPTHWLSSE